MIISRNPVLSGSSGTSATSNFLRAFNQIRRSINDLLPSDMRTPLEGQLVPRQQDSSSYSGDPDGDDTGPSHSMSTYYFVFFAILICIAILCVYFVWRKRRNALMVRPSLRGSGYRRGVQEWDSVGHRRRYWNTNSRSGQVSREEGLNENGEAPPPYMPKDDEETGHAGPRVDGQHTHGGDRPVPGEPAIPMQALSRDQAGLKPPGYDQVVQPSSNGPSGSRSP